MGLFASKVAGAGKQAAATADAAAPRASSAPEVEDKDWPGLDALRKEVEQLRASPPPFVSKVGDVSVPGLVCSSAGAVLRPPRPKSEGPWDVVVVLSGGLTEDERRESEAAAGDIASLRDAARAASKALAEAERELAQARAELEELSSCESAATAPRARGFWALPSAGTWLLPLTTAAAAAAASAADAADSLGAAAARAEEARLRLARVCDEERRARDAVADAEASRARLRAAEAYDFPFRVCVRFDSSWPAEPPAQVRFQGIIHHALTDDDGSLPKPFFNTLPKEGGCSPTSRYTLHGVVQAVHDFLVDPLKAWGVPADSAPQRFSQQLLSGQDMNSRRLNTIRKYSTMVKHPALFESPPRWRQEWFVPEVWRALQRGTPEALRAVLTENVPGEVFSFDMFTQEFCDMFVEEIFNFYASGLPAKRPNSMNNYGIILNEIGLEPMIDELQRLLQPLGELFWPEGPGSAWDGQHCFIVRYREGEDLGLDMHTDDSEVTFNLCLGLDFQGAGLQFCGVMGAANHRKLNYTYKHEKGRCVFHLGRKRHGADDITSGERLNLILWNHSSTFRQSSAYNEPDYAEEEGPPDQVCVSYTHDRDYGNFKDYPKGKEHFRGRGWCPPKDYEYEGFKPDSDKVARS